MRSHRLELAIEPLELGEHATHAQDRVAPFTWTAAVGGTAFRLDLEPRKSLVCGRDLKIGGFGHDGAAGPPSRHERVSAETGVLLIDDRRHDQAAGIQSVLRHDARRVDHRGDASLHVLRAASVKPAVALHGIERRLHPFDADGVNVPTEHQRAPLATSPENPYALPPPPTPSL